MAKGHITWGVPSRILKEKKAHYFLFIHTLSCHTFFVFYIFIYLFSWAPRGCSWGLRTNLQESALSFHPVGMENWTWVIRHGSRRFYLLSHLKSPKPHTSVWGYLSDTCGSPVTDLSPDTAAHVHIRSHSAWTQSSNTIPTSLASQPNWKKVATYTASPANWLWTGSSHNPLLRFNLLRHLIDLTETSMFSRFLMKDRIRTR